VYIRGKEEEYPISYSLEQKQNPDFAPAWILQIISGNSFSRTSDLLDEQKKKRHTKFDHVLKQPRIMSSSAFGKNAMKNLRRFSIFVACSLRIALFLQ
jgi:hypothetical protein